MHVPLCAPACLLRCTTEWKVWFLRNECFSVETADSAFPDGHRGIWEGPSPQKHLLLQHINILWTDIRCWSTLGEAFIHTFILSFPSLEICIAAAAAAKSLQSCLTLCNPIEGSPPGSLVPGILQARTLEWVAISFSNARKWKNKVKSLSHIRLLVTPWTAAYQAPPSMEFSRQEYWSGVPSPSPEICIECVLNT